MKQWYVLYVYIIMSIGSVSAEQKSSFSNIHKNKLI